MAVLAAPMNSMVLTPHREAAEDAHGPATLLARIERGEPAALGLLYALYKRPVYSVARRLLRDTDAAQDVVQDVFVAIWQGASSYDAARGSVRTWILALAHHKSVDALRRRRATAPLDEATVDDGDVVDEALRRLTGTQVRGALRGLTQLQRQVLVLAYYGGYSQQEIADRLGVPLGTVKTRMRDGLIKLRGLLALQAAH
jgi:RNA polymerase sigma-70 factor (ECF subfamily)